EGEPVAHLDLDMRLLFTRVGNSETKAAIEFQCCRHMVNDQAKHIEFESHDFLPFGVLHDGYTSLNSTSYAVPHTNAFSPAAAWYLPFYLCFVFALAERKNETQKEGEVPL